ncbi:MAG: serine hydrolase [Anaerolineae bacterium]|nr:serine hydrolase [Anaerolineae bacterium]
MHRTIPERVGLSSERLGRIAPIMQGYVDRGQVAGLSTLVARHGQIAHMECFGQADIARGRPVTPDTIYRIYSMSKPITAVAALTLYERGLYTLYDPISAYIPSFKDGQVLVSLSADGQPQTVPVEREITIKDLFRHTSGLVSGNGERDIDKVYQRAAAPLRERAELPTTAEFMDGLARLPLAFQPGQEYFYGYSNDVLGRLIEVLTGMRFSEFLQRELFEPLGMTDTAFWVPEEKRERFAALYRMDQGLELEASPGARRYDRPPAFESGGGGLASTLGDYARFAQMLVNGGELDGVRILGRKTVQLMGTNHLEPQQQACFDARMNKRGYGYGLGVRVMHDLSKAATAGSLGEFGWDGAASTWFCVDPVEDLIAVHMIQMMPFAYYPIMLQFQALVYQALI